MKRLEIPEKFSKRQSKKDPHLHSANHVLADELSLKLSDSRHFGFYLKAAVTHDHSLLRSLAGQVLESKGVKSPGKLFAYLLKQHNEKTRK